jgi:ankyrin repeat protein
LPLARVTSRTVSDKKNNMKIALRLLALAGILGMAIAISVLKSTPTVHYTSGGNECVNYQRPPILNAGEADPVVENAIQRIHQRLVEAKDHLPALSEISEAAIGGYDFLYQKGKIYRYRTGKLVSEPLDSCYLALHAYYPFRKEPMQPWAPTKEYSVEADGFAYNAWLTVSSGKDEICGIIEREMDRAAKELQTVALSKMLKAGEEIHMAVRSGDATKVEQLLAGKPELANAKDRRGFAPLHWAKNKCVAELLLARKPDINATDKLGFTPLHWAVYDGHFDLVKLFVANKADVNAKADGGWTPTNLAEELCGEAGPETLFLLQHGGVPGIPDAKLNYVIKHPGTPSLRRVLQRRPDVVTMKDERGRTALSHAVGSSNTQVMELLLAAGAEVNIRDNFGNTPLQYASVTRNVKAVELLLANKADVNVRNGKHETPLDRAERIGSPAVVDLLQKHGALRGAGAINDAVRRRDMAKVKELLNSQPTIVSEKSSSGWSLVHAALSQNSNEIMKVLLEHNADVNARNGEGQTALHFVIIRSRLGRDSKNMEIIEAETKEAIGLLLAHGADVNAKDALGATALHHAAGRRNLEFTKLLLANKADINARDKDGRTPLDWAAMVANDPTGNYPFSVFLREHGGRTKKEFENADAGRISGASPGSIFSLPHSRPEQITHNGVPLTSSQSRELRELPEMKTAMEAMREAAQKYQAVNDAAMVRLGYHFECRTNRMPDGQIHMVLRRLMTSEGVPLTAKQLNAFQDAPEIKAARDACKVASENHVAAMRAAMAKLGYRIGYGTNRVPSVVQWPSSGAGTNRSAQMREKQ